MLSYVKKYKASYSQNNNMQKVPLKKRRKNIRHLMYSEQWMLLRHTNSQNKRKENIIVIYQTYALFY
jgi:hypothetical protein